MSGPRTWGDLFPHLLDDPRYHDIAAEPLPGPDGPRSPLVVRGFGDSSTGYGRMTAHLMRGLEAAGVPTEFHPIHVDRSRVPLDPFLDERIPVAMRASGPCLRMASPHQVSGTGDAVLSMWESSRIPPEFPPRYNAARVVIVPCHSNAEWFRDSGVTAPIRVVPLGIDPEVYRPAPRGPREGIRVLAMARVAHGGERKGIEDVLSVWIEALGDRPDCSLTVKLWPDCEVVDPGHPRVTLDRASYDDAGLADLYRSHDAFLTLSRGEGWGMSPLEAMGCGVPVIAPIHSGMADYLTSDCCYPVEFDAEPAGGVYYTGHGDWFRYRRVSAVAQLRAAHDDPEGRRRKGEAAASRALEFTWERSGRELVAVLREFGLVDAPPPTRARAGVDPAVRSRILACPHRGPEGALSLLDEEKGCCGAGDERTACSAGKGRRPGRVTLRECLACKKDG